MATLTYRHFGNPGWRGLKARFNLVHKKALLELFSDLIMHETYGNALQYHSRWPHAAAAGSRGLAAAGFRHYIYNIRYYSYLHAIFQEDWPKKKNSKFFIWKFAAFFSGHTVLLTTSGNCTTAKPGGQQNVLQYCRPATTIESKF